jgi:hypothetical protein
VRFTRTGEASRCRPHEYPTGHERPLPCPSAADTRRA